MSTALVRSTKPQLPWWKRVLVGLAKRAIVGLDGFNIGSSNPYAGARVTRLLQDWIMSCLSADTEVRGDLYQLRSRSRELARNSAYARRFLQLVRANVVGPHGIRLQARIRAENKRPFETVNMGIEDAWAEWSRKENCTVDRKLSWRDVQSLLATSLPQDGEFIIRIVRGFQNPFAFALQLIDPDLLEVTFNRPRGTGVNGAGVNEIRMGVEIDEWGAPVAYHLLKRHPSETGPDRGGRERVLASDIIHDFIPLRVQQRRGVPWFHPVLVPHRMLEGYQEAELVAARTAAAKPGFFKVSADAAQNMNPDEAVDDVPHEVEPGTFHELPPGYEFQGFDPQHPTAAYKDYVGAVLRGIASGLGVSYHSLANDLSGVNYSSARVGELADRDEWRSLQQWMIDHVHFPIYVEWLKMALLSGALQLSSVDYRKYTRVAWRPRGWAWVDPRNELDASEKELQIGLNSRTRQAAEQGRDFEEICEELAEEQKLIDEHGLKLGPVAGAPTDKPGDEKKPTTDGEDDEDAKPERKAPIAITR